MLVSPAAAASLIGVSRQALIKQRPRLDRSGQAQSEGGKWRIQSDGLLAWWVGHVRVGESWSRAVAVRKLLGDAAEDALLAIGGMDALDLLVALLPGAEWLIGTNDDGLPVAGPPDGPLLPLPEVWRLVGEAVAEMPKGSRLDLETGQVIGADGEAIGPWEVKL
jgi:hypothetical protein